MNKKPLQCFYNCNYNHGSPTGQSKFVWGFGYFDLIGDEVKPLSKQVIEIAKLDESEVFNLNLTSFTPFHDDLFEESEHE